MSKLVNKLPEHVCNCQECQHMCKFPCLGTPDEIQAIISAGYAYSNKLVVCSDNHPDLNFTVVRPRRIDKHCIYFENGKCQLHDAGLKPLEGRVAIHGEQIVGKPFYRRLARFWNTKKGRALIERIRLENHRPENPYSDYQD